MSIASPGSADAVFVPPPAGGLVSKQATLNVIAVIVAALYFGRDVLIPLALAILLSIILSPLIALLRRLRLGRAPSVFLAVFIAVTIIFGVGGLIGSQLARLADDAPAYARTIEQKTAVVRGYVVREIGRAANGIGYAPTGKVAPAAALLPGTLKDGPKLVAVEMHQPDLTPVKIVERYLSPVLSPVGTVGIVFVVTIFILLQQEDLRDRLKRLLGASDIRKTTVALARHMSPYLGDRMLASRLLDKAVFIRELMPQDRKLDIEHLTQAEAMSSAKFLSMVVGRAHARQMGTLDGQAWLAELQRSRSKSLDAPSWLWAAVVDLIGSHERAYLEHCRRYALAA